MRSSADESDQPEPHRGVREFRGFRALVPPSAWTELAGLGVRRTYRAGECVFRQGEPGGWHALVVTGRLGVLYAEPAGPQVLLAVRGPGDLLGEFSGRDPAHRSATVEALENVVAYAIPDARFTEFVRRNDLTDRLDKYVMAKVRQSATRTWQLAHHDGPARLAALLDELVAAAGDEHPRPYEIPLSQQRLAGVLGMSRSWIAGIIGGWRRAGIVETARGTLVVTDPAALRATPRH